MATINPYLIFNGNCEEAFNFYKSVFGGEFPYVGRFKEMPSETPISKSEEEKIMHISLPIGQGGTILMGSDSSESLGQVSTIGNNFSISVNTETEAEAISLFNRLSVGGKVTMPLNKTFWGAYFGMFIDKFGVSWMVNYDYNQKA